MAEPTSSLQMDQHIEQMAKRLHAQLPGQKCVLGAGFAPDLIHGAEFISWAICDADQNPPEMTQLDRHEMAHALIEALCSVDQDPPMLLCEGWAETQSEDCADLILTLKGKVETDATYTLQELVEPQWYDRSLGPGYTHGGPSSFI